MAGTGPIRVCFVSPKVYPLFNHSIEAVFGGAEVDLYMIGTELAKDSGFEVVFITADYGQQQAESIEGVKILKSLNLKSNALVGAFRIWQAMKKADADIYVIKTASPGVPLVWAYCRLHKNPFVYRTAHSDECDGTYLKKHFFAGRAFKAALKKASVVFAQNNEDAAALKNTTGVKSVVVPNAHRLRQSPPKERDIILWTGRSAEFKQPDVFVSLARKFPGERFVMICQQAAGDDDYPRLLRRVGIIPNIEFHPRVGFEQIDEYFSRAKIFVNTSRAEGFPNTFIQACMAGAAILSLNVDPDGFLDRYNCGVSCAGSEDILADRLRHLLSMERFIELGENGRRYARENHDIAKVIVEYKRIFRELVENKAD